MKELLKQLAAYNVWANQRITDIIISLPEEKHKAEITSSFNSLHTTILHIWDAESIWWQRMKLHERIVRPSDNPKGSTRDVINGLLSQSKLWDGWVSNASELSLDHVFQFNSKKGEPVKMYIYQMLVHVFNHSTYHRGQLINMLRQLGVEKVPSTDFSLWVRNKK